MNQEEAFLQAILDEPDDNVPRLVYADWIEENGDPERARFIRAQCRLARLDEDDPARLPLLRDEWVYLGNAQEALKLAVKKRPAWLANVPTWATTWLAFERGFPARVRTTAKRFVAKAEELLQAVPVQHAFLNNLKPSVEAVAGCAALAKLRSLDLSYNGLTPEAMRPLILSPHLTNLTRLRWSHGQLTVAKMADFAAAPMLTNLRTLELPSNPIRDTGTEALAASPLLTHLESLDLTQCNIGPRGAKALAESPPLGRLRHLYLCDNLLADKGALALAASRHLDQLISLDVSSNEIEPQTTAVLLDPPGLPALRRLRIGDTEWGDQLWSQTPAARLRGGLTCCQLSLHEWNAKHMVDSPLLAACRGLDVATGESGDQWIAPLVGSPAIAGLETLRLHWCGLTAAGARALAGSPHLGRLRELSLEHNPLGDKSVGPLLAAPWLRRLTRLNLWQTKITAPAVRRLVRSGALDEIAEIRLFGHGVEDDVSRELRERFGTRIAFW